MRTPGGSLSAVHGAPERAHPQPRERASGPPRRGSRGVADPRRSTRPAPSASAARVSRWSNQCAVESCSARNRVIGGSSAPGRSAHARSISEPAARATPAGTLHDGGRTPEARQMPASSSPTGRGSPFVMTNARPCTARGLMQRRRDAGRGVVDVGGVDEGATAVEQRQTPATRAVDDAADELRVARSPHEMGADGDDVQGGRVAGEGEQLRFGLRAGVLAAGVGRRRRIRPDAGERGAGVGDRRRGDLHEAGCPGSAGLIEEPSACPRR